jgi:hypothetical protein
MNVRVLGIVAVLAGVGLVACKTGGPSTCCVPNPDMMGCTAGMSCSTVAPMPASAARGADSQAAEAPAKTDRDRSGEAAGAGPRS